jgi:hypothetical protein
MEFEFKPDLKKGKRNRLRVGQKVEAKQQMVDWHASHLSWCAGKPVHGDSAYDIGQKEVRIEDLSFVYIWTFAKLSGKMPTGTVVRYGALDDTYDEDGKILDRKNVFVEFKVRTAFGVLKYSCYSYESELKKIVNKK